MQIRGERFINDSKGVFEIHSFNRKIIHHHLCFCIRNSQLRLSESISPVSEICYAFALKLHGICHFLFIS